MASKNAVQCDNPTCKNFEIVDEAGFTPYMWVNLDLYIEGPGPIVKGVVACSEECIGPAAVAMLEKAQEEERYG